MQRWALWIDIEGFRNNFPKNSGAALQSLNALMLGIFRIGNYVCPSTPERLFAYHLGDGFIVVSEFAERSPELPIAIGVVLMREVLKAGGTCKCSISQGEFGDYTGCYPEEVTSHAEEGFVRLGGGHMQVLPVMGTALINSFGMGKKERGSVLIVDRDIFKTTSPEIPITQESDKYFVIDWIHASTKEIDEIYQKTGLSSRSITDYEKLLNEYLSKNIAILDTDWVVKTRKSAGL